MSKEREEIVKYWGDDGIEVLNAIDNSERVTDSMRVFLKSCTACGGNWGGMFLSGIKELYPSVYNAIPDNMGRMAFVLLCDVLALLGIDSSK